MNHAISTLNTQHLVVTTIGKNKTGLVSELTGLIAECQCNILDSKMAIFGGEFSMIMLLAGDGPSLSQIEMRLPQLAMRLDLLSMMKRTSAHTELTPTQYVLQAAGPDQSGTIKALTSHLAQNQADVVSLRSGVGVEKDQPWQQAEIVVELPEGSDYDDFEQGVFELCKQLNMSLTITAV